MTDYVNYKITACDLCPNMDSKRHYTADSFEMIMEWFCKAKKDKKIALHERGDVTPPIPKWCPLRKP
jgi:hypothetical protein